VRVVDVRAIDLCATTGRGARHRATPVTKLGAFAFVLAAVVVQNNVLIVASIALALAAIVLAARLPARRVFGLAAYPAIFAIVFSFAGAPDLLMGALFVAKAVTAALAAVTLVFTTPYPQIFAPLQAVTPSVVGDAMLMTYRSLFLLGEKLAGLQRAIRLRSGLAAGHPVRAARATAAALGGLVLYAFDLSQREYDVMRLRGYEGRLRVTMPKAANPVYDVTLLAGAAALCTMAVLWRVGAAALNPYSWFPAAVASCALAAAIVWRWVSR
jgi:energy-coupling factor transporter transmembrane protein EcfT